MYIQIIHDIHERATTSVEDAQAVTLIPWQSAGGPLTVTSKELASVNVDMTAVQAHS